MTTRRRLAWLIGLVPFAAKGQRMCTDDSRTALIKIPGMHVCDDQHKPPAWQTGKALNNQCPVCAQMAPPYLRPTEHANDGFAPIPGTNMAREINPREEVMPGWWQTDRVTRCLRCNNAFFQDAVN